MGRRPKVTREEVLDAARQVFAERGFEGTTLASIAARLDVSPAALLRHAANKEELFAASMHQPPEIRVPVEFLREVDGSEDPREVIRRIVQAFIPFLEQKIDEQISRWMRSKALEDPAKGFPLPFDPQVRPTPPQRALALIEDWLQRAVAAGRLRLNDPHAAAMVLLGACQAYVMLHKIVRVEDPPLPLDRYIDTVVEIWTQGAVR